MSVETKVFSALADPTRREILDRVSAGAATSTRIASDLGISRQAVAKHFAILEEACLVTSEKQGRERVYTAEPEVLKKTAQYLMRLGAAWDQRLAALRDLVDEAAS